MERALSSSRGATRAFTLIELIGVLAIISIIAAIAVPSVFRGVDAAAARAEVLTLREIGDQVKLYVRQGNPVLASTNWTTVLTPYVDSGRPLSLNARRGPRVFISEPVTAGAVQRVLILSCLFGDNSYTLPPASAINTGRFNELWDLSDTDVLPWNSSWWSGATAWVAGTPADQLRRRDYLLIERVNLRPLQLAVAVTLNQTSASGTGSYRVTRATGTVFGDLLPGAAPLPLNPLLQRNDQIRLFREAGSIDANEVYRYTVTDGAPAALQFEFDGTRWFSR